MGLSASLGNAFKGTVRAGGTVIRGRSHHSDVKGWSVARIQIASPGSVWDKHAQGRRSARQLMLARLTSARARPAYRVKSACRLEGTEHVSVEHALLNITALLIRIQQKKNAMLCNVNQAKSAKWEYVKEGTVGG